MNDSRMTLRRLAEMLELSPTTVSRALNGYPEVSEATRERVIRSARALGYAPDRSASRLAHGVAGAFGLVFPSSSDRLIDPLFAEFIGGVADFAATAGIEISLQAVRPEDELDAYRRAVAQHSVDGFIVSSPFVDDPRIKLLHELETPFICHGRTDFDAPYPWMDIDNRGAFERAARLLADYGHRRVALVGGEHGLTFARDRTAGAAAGLARHGLELRPDMVHPCAMTEEMGYRVGCDALAAPDEVRPTAFLCASIFLALGVQRAGREHGLSAPEDFALIAHDDRTPSLRAEFMTPPLTATQSSIRKAGRRVAEMLQARVAGTPVAELQEEWPVELVLRDSVGRAGPARI